MITEVAVVVPAREEQDCLASCVASVQAAAAALGESRPDVVVRLVLALDDPDGYHALPSVDHVSVVRVLAPASTAGAARAAGTAHVLATRAGGSEHGLWLANTDADSVVPVDWLTVMVALAELGADLVLGTVVPHADLHPRLRAGWRERYHMVDGHPHVHGANLGIRADLYDRVGGWSAVVTGEDVDLARRAGADLGARVRRTAQIPVVTSARLTGRAPGGFASYLAALDAGLSPPA